VYGDENQCMHDLYHRITYRYLIKVQLEALRVWVDPLLLETLLVEAVETLEDLESVEPVEAIESA
jgi:hypothetical protein